MIHALLIFLDGAIKPEIIDQVTPKVRVLRSRPFAFLPSAKFDLDEMLPAPEMIEFVHRGKAGPYQVYEENP